MHLKRPLESLDREATLLWTLSLRNVNQLRVIIIETATTEKKRGREIYCAIKLVTLMFQKRTCSLVFPESNSRKEFRIYINSDINIWTLIYL